MIAEQAWDNSISTRDRPPHAPGMLRNVPGPNAAGGNPLKRKRDIAKCEECRVRKIKCKPEVYSGACDNCQKNNFHCSGRQPHRKRHGGTADQSTLDPALPAGHEPESPLPLDIDLVQPALQTRPPLTLTASSSYPTTSFTPVTSNLTATPSFGGEPWLHWPPIPTLPQSVQQLNGDLDDFYGRLEILRDLQILRDTVERALPTDSSLSIAELGGGDIRKAKHNRIQQLGEALKEACNDVGKSCRTAARYVKRHLSELDISSIDVSLAFVLGELRELFYQRLKLIGSELTVSPSTSSSLKITTVDDALMDCRWRQINAYDSFGLRSTADQLCQEVACLLPNGKLEILDDERRRRIECAYKDRSGRMQALSGLWDELNPLPQLKSFRERVAEKDQAFEPGILMAMHKICWSIEHQRSALAATPYRNILKRSLLQIACESDSFNCEHLLQADAQEYINQRDIFKMAAVHIAALSGNLAAIKCLHGLGAELEKVYDIYGRTPLFLASQQGHTEIVRYLLTETGCGVDHGPWGLAGPTPLFAAAKGNHHETVTVLLEQGADVGIRHLRRTAAEEASIRKHLAVQWVFSKHAQKPPRKEKKKSLPGASTSSQSGTSQNSRDRSQSQRGSPRIAMVSPWYGSDSTSRHSTIYGADGTPQTTNADLTWAPQIHNAMLAPASTTSMTPTQSPGWNIGFQSVAIGASQLSTSMIAPFSLNSAYTGTMLPEMTEQSYVVLDDDEHEYTS
jgi:hypothetical protein